MEPYQKQGPCTAKLTGHRATIVAVPLVLDFAEEHAELAFQTWPGNVLLGTLLEEIGLAGRAGCP